MPNHHPTRLSFIASFLACAFLASCDGERNVTEPVEEPKLTQSWLDSAVDSTTSGLERIRGLKFTSEVKGEIVKRESYDSLMFALSRFEEGDTAESYWALNDRTMVILGITDTMGQWSRAQQWFDESSITGFYHPRTCKLYVFDDVGQDDRVYTVVHEMVHALQDQAFGLDESSAWIRESDEDLAFTYAIEGEAEYLATALISGIGTATEMKETVDQSRFTLDILAMGLDSWAKQNSIPMTMILPMMAPYYMGPHLASERRFRSGWAGVDSFFTHPLRTTRASIDPDVADVVRDWNPGGCPAVSGSFRPLQTGRLGALQLGSLVWGNLDSKLRLGALADAWRGDRFWTFHGDSGSALLWRTAWKDTATAQAFARTWWLERAQRRTLWKTIFYALMNDTVKTASDTGNTNSVFVRVRGSEVDIVEGFSTVETRDLEAKLSAIPVRSIVAAREASTSGSAFATWIPPRPPVRLPPPRIPGLTR